ncbi:MAG: phosphoribosyl-AMP cyclohydrolase [Alphaproteobacteria bacterium]|nr:phosphoribosyl-AMP cyclohydrolase [Alphaproteobacteria bacterium]
MTDQNSFPVSMDPKERELGTTLAPKFDSHGLVTAIAVEAGTGAVLMLAHMDEKALRLTLETAQVHFFSRSRGKIWRKGETSGEVLNVVEMRVDCDQDAILLVVDPAGTGAACHTGRKSCFYRRVVPGKSGFELSTPDQPPLFDPEKVYKS